MYLSFDELSFSIQCHDEYGRNALDALDADPVVSCEISKAVCNQAAFKVFNRPHDVRTMPDDEIGSCVHHHARKFDDVAAWLAEILFFLERHVCDVPSLGPAVK